MEITWRQSQDLLTSLSSISGQIFVLTIISSTLGQVTTSKSQNYLGLMSQSPCDIATEYPYDNQYPSQT